MTAITGLSSAYLAKAVAEKFIVTLAGNTTSGFGYVLSSFGSITDGYIGVAPGGLEFFYTGDPGRINTAISGSAVPVDFELSFIETGASGFRKDLVTGIYVQDSSSVYRKYYTANATFDPAQGQKWRWGNGSNPVWTAATPSPRELYIFM